MFPLRAASGGLVIVVLVGCAGSGSAMPTASQTSTASPVSTTRESPAGSPTSVPSPSPDATDAGSGDVLEWSEAAAFDAADGEIILVTDLSAWDRGFLAVGHVWTEGNLGGAGKPRVWTSDDGRTWTEADPGPGASGAELRAILRLSSGGALILGNAPSNGTEPGGATIGSAAWRTDDGRIFDEVELPSEIAAQAVSVGSGPIGHVVSTGTALWYTVDAESWQLAYEAPEGIRLRQPVAGDEGFVVPATNTEGGAPTVVASGDGIAWFASEPPTELGGVSPLGGDWLGWGHTDAPTLSLFRSANGLDWSPVLDVNELTPPDGPKAGQGMESGITEARLVGEGGVVVLTLGWNHCCAVPPDGVDVFTSTDGETWERSDLPESAYVMATATDGEVMVIGGHVDRGGRAVFWVAER